MVCVLQTDSQQKSPELGTTVKIISKEQQRVEKMDLGIEDMLFMEVNLHQ